MSDAAIEAARRARESSTESAWEDGGRALAECAAREALTWAADVLAQEIREQWAADAERPSMPGAQLIALRLQVLEKVIRGGVPHEIDSETRYCVGYRDVDGDIIRTGSETTSRRHAEENLAANRKDSPGTDWVLATRFITPWKVADDE